MNDTIHFLPMAYLGLLIMSYAILSRFKLLPTMEAIQDFATMLNTKGGNIMLLGFFSMVFFAVAITIIMWCLNRAIEGKLSADNAVMMLGITFVTGTCFGGAFGPMLKVMSGEMPVPLNGNGNGHAPEKPVSPPPVAAVESGTSPNQPTP